jgi:RNA polymerase sigma-70 factor (ECF subfamily)
MEGQEGRARARLAEMIAREPRRLPKRIGRLIHDGVAAEDLAQESLLRALRNVATLRGADEAVVCKWLDRIACNLAFNYARDEGRRPVGVSIDADVSGLAATLPSLEPEPAVAISQAEVQHALLDLIRALPAEIRAVLILRDVEGLSTAESASALGIGEGLVKWRLHQARKQLREQLAEQALSDVS